MASEPLVIGLTGGIGSGKSSAARLFAAHGARIIDTDEISHALSNPPSLALEAIASQFGPEFLCKDGTLDRKKMREQVFADPGSRKKLETIFHPLIREEVRKRLDEATACPYTILVVPLLFETRAFLALVSRCIVVDCPEEMQIARVMERSQLDREGVIAIMDTQISREKRLEQAHHIIYNDGSFQHLEEQVQKLHRLFLCLCDSVE